MIMPVHWIYFFKENINIAILRKGLLFISKIEPPLFKYALLEVWFQFAHWFWRRFLRVFNVFSLYPTCLKSDLYLRYRNSVNSGLTLVRLHYIAIILPWKRACSCIWTNLNPLCSKIYVPRFIEIFQEVLRLWKSSMYMYLNKVLHIPSLDEGVLLHLNKLEFPLPKDVFCQIKLKLSKQCWN